MGTTATMREPQSVDSSSSFDNDTGSSSSRTSWTESNQSPRKLWWTPRQSQVAIPTEPVQYNHVRSKVGSLANIEHRPGGGQKAIVDEPVRWKVSSRIDSLSNATWSPSAPRSSIQQEKLKWNAQSKVNSFDNIKHKPGGGVVRIYDEKLDFDHVSSRVDSGFTE